MAKLLKGLLLLLLGGLWITVGASGIVPHWAAVLYGMVALFTFFAAVGVITDYGGLDP